ncbi:MAG TPA: DUF2630 family protein [Ktedonobacteraceae bacterium]|jgi:uncharacterized protein DUF2630|nr:DUF2630 family protein [Ktedonobacteraceae bacterium]
MDDTEILHRIQQLVDEEHALMQQHTTTADLSEEQHARMRAVEVSLDQCWDLLRQRRARRQAGLNPDEAKVRDAQTVEHYLQ